MEEKFKTWEQTETKIQDMEYKQLDLKYSFGYGTPRYNKESEGNAASLFLRINRELEKKDYTDDPVLLSQYLNEILGDKDKGTLDAELQGILETEYYHTNYADTNKRSRLSEDLYINKKLESLATKLINLTNDSEYPLLSKYAENMNTNREKFINDDEDEDPKLGIMPNGLHEDIVELFNNEQTQSIINNFKMSEKQKRQLRNKNIKPDDFKKYPELLHMYEAKLTLENELGLSDGLTDKDKEEKRNTYLSNYSQLLYKEKEKAFDRWANGQSRLDKETIERFKKNPKKFEELLINEVWKPIISESELESKFQNVVRYYGNANNAISQYNKAKRIKNDIGYEMTVIKQRLEPVVGFRGQRVTSINVRQNQEELEHKFHFGDPKMIEGLLFVDTETSEPVKDDNGKSIRFKYSIPLFQVLEDKHKNHNTYVNNHILSKFRQLVKSTKLEDYENAIVKMIIDPIYNIEEKGNVRENLYRDIIDKLNNTYDLSIKNKRQLKTLIRKLSKKISNTYLDEIEKDKLGTVKCSKCKEDKVASTRNFGKNSKNTGRKGLKSICKSCENV
ncbi:hypothetical protein [Lentibacillus salicampi]|uniref:Uncharacterized protein n=1 Tax=Lentibacillus salicampi TaxID=175306 RepID=A0A4Y9AE84_9BACI|nr:hypothetical protein [Lentibacillus salicampi]TFJ93642.1 hypothetical protein E4U82_06710 [Lentibacillus salicampi]